MSNDLHWATKYYSQFQSISVLDPEISQLKIIDDGCKHLKQ